MPSAVFSYRNFCLDPEATITNTTGSFRSDAPVTNLMTPRLADVAIAATSPPGNLFEVVFRPGSPSVGVPVRLVALLNHNIVSFPDNFPSPFNMTIYDVNGKVYYNETPEGLIRSVGADGSFQNHAFFLIPADATDLSGLDLGPLDLSRIAQFSVGLSAEVVCGTMHPYTGQVDVQPFQAGGLWAGPIFQPINGISLDGFSQSAADNSRVMRSIGAQVWATPETRQRTASIEFSKLYESEVYRLLPETSLQQMAAYCGISRPMIMLPISSDDDLVYLAGIYGYAASPPKWVSTEKSPLNGVRERLYTASLDLVEAR